MKSWRASKSLYSQGQRSHVKKWSGPRHWRTLYAMTRVWICDWAGRKSSKNFIWGLGRAVVLIIQFAFRKIILAWLWKVDWNWVKLMSESYFRMRYGWRRGLNLIWSCGQLRKSNRKTVYIPQVRLKFKVVVKDSLVKWKQYDLWISQSAIY